MARVLLVALFFLGTALGNGASKVNAVLEKLKEPKKGKALESFVLTQQEINDFTAIAVQSKKRLGVKQVTFNLKQAGTFHTKALVNMNDVKLEGFAFRMFKTVLSGVQTLEAEGKLTTNGGKGVYEVESARFNHIPVPAFLVNAVISFLGKRQPPHIDVTEPFAYPYGIKDIKIVPGKVVLIR